MEAGAIGQVVCRAEKWVNCCYANLRRILSVSILVLLAGLTGFAGADTLYVYDAAGRLTGVTNSAGDSAQYRYSPAGNLMAVESSTSGQLVFGQLTPDVGPVGSSVTISGSGFSTAPAGNSVTFNGISATISSASADRLVVIVPTGASTGAVAVTVGATTVKSTRPFTVTEGPVNQVPQITSFTPGVGLAHTAVTIAGQNFDPASSAVSFNGVGAVVSTVTATQIEVQVPAIATSGPIKISTPFGDALSSSDFIVPPTGYTEAQIGVTGRIAVDGDPKAFTGLGASSKIGLILFDGIKGQRLGLGISPVALAAGSSVMLYIKTPDGNDLVNGRFLTGGSTIALPALPASGTYSIMIVPKNASTALNATFTLSTRELNGVLVPGGEVQTFTARVGQLGRYTFTAQAGQNMRLLWVNQTFTGTYNTFEVNKPDGAILSRWYFGIVTNPSGIGELENLPVTGTYTVVATPDQTNAGSIRLWLLNPQEGEVSIDGEPLKVTLSKGERGDFLFDGVQGQNLGLGIGGLTTTASSGKLKVTIYAPDGSTVVKSCGSYSAPGGKCVLPPLSSSGAYIVRVSPEGVYGATFVLTLSNEVVGTLPDGVVQTFATERVGQNGRYTFSGKAGENVSLSWSGATFAGGSSTIDIYQPDGKVLTSQLFNGSSGSTTASGVLSLLNLPATGQYTAIVSPYGTSTGNVSLQLQRNVTGELVVDGSPLTTTLSVGQLGDYRFNGVEGQNLGLGVAGLTTTASGGKVKITVYTPNGSTVVKSCGTYVAPGGKCILPSLPLSGAYTVRVAPQGVYGAALVLTLSNDVGGTLTEGVAQTFATGRVGQNGRYTFTAQAGQNMQLTFGGTTLAGTVNTLEIYQPNGTQLLGRYFGKGATNYVSGALNLENLPATGGYTVVVIPSETNTGKVILTLMNDQEGELSVDGDLLRVALNAGGGGRFLFHGEQGQKLYLGMDEIKMTDSNGFIATVIRGPDGVDLVKDCGGNYKSYGQCSVPSLPKTGIYSIRIVPTGPYDVSLRLALSSNVTGVLVPGEAQTATARVGQIRRYTFTAQAGQNMRLMWSNATFVGSYNAIEVDKPDGAILEKWYIGQGSSGSGVKDLNNLPVTGTYTVVVTPDYSREGSVILQLLNDPEKGKILVDGEPLKVTLDKGERGDFLFDGVQDQNLELSIGELTTTLKSGKVTVTVYGPNGSTIVKSCGSYAAPGGKCVLPPLPSSGTHTVRVSAEGVYGATLGLSLINKTLGAFMEGMVQTLTAQAGQTMQRVSPYPVDMGGIAQSLQSHLQSNQNRMN